MENRGHLMCFGRAAVLLAMVPLSALAQEKPLSLSGAITTGFYSSEDQARGLSHFSTVPFSVLMEAKGFLGHPDFLSYELQPQVSVGRQAREAGFVDGDGISLRSTFLRRRAFPLRLTYRNIQQEQFTYGSVERLTGLRSLTRSQEFGANWALRLPHLPRLALDYSRNSSLLDPENPIVPYQDTGNSQYGLRIDDDRWGWNLEGQLRWMRFSTDFSNPLEPDLITVATRRHSAEQRFSASRKLWGRNQFTFLGGQQKGHNTFNDRPYDQEVRYLNSFLNFYWGERWEGDLRAGYTSNRFGLFQEQALHQFTGNTPSGSGGMGALEYLPFWTNWSTLNLLGRVRYELSPSWNLFGGMDQSSVRRPGSVEGQIRGGTTIANAGVTFNRSYSWARMNGQYTLDVGRLSFGEAGTSGLQGHTFTLSAQRGSVEKLQLDGTFTAHFRNVSRLFPLNASAEAVDIGLGRAVRGLVLRGSVGVQRSSMRNSFDYFSDNLTYRASVEHQRFQLSYSHNAMEGTSLLPIVSGGGLLPDTGDLPLRSVFTTLRADSAEVRLRPTRKLWAQFLWRIGGQDLDSRFRNRYENVELSVMYNFRQLALEVGYNGYDQVFAFLTNVRRSRFFFRVTRRFQLF